MAVITAATGMDLQIRMQMVCKNGRKAFRDCILSLSFPIPHRYEVIVSLLQSQEPMPPLVQRICPLPVLRLLHRV